MKRLFFIVTLLISVIFSAKAQPSKAKISKPKQNYLDSGFVKQPKQINNQNRNQAGNVRAKQPSKNQQVKLDDLKNPFDTGNVKTVRTRNKIPH